LGETLPLLAQGKVGAAASSVKAYTRWVRAVHGIRKLLVSDRVELIYGYWMNAEAFAAAHLRKEDGGPFVMSRAHGVDLYEDRWPASHMPLRSKMITGIDRILPISQAGHEHLVSLFPWLSERIEVHRLGVASLTEVSSASGNDEFHVVTVASCVPIKRLDRVPLALAAFRDRVPEIRLTWTHIGDGPEMERLREVTRQRLAAGVRVEFLGEIPPPSVLKHLQSQRFDLILNVSDSEGVPVALMEGMACGIPALGPEVGGIPELIKHGVNGWLLPPRPSPDDIAEALVDVWAKSKTLETRRSAVATVRELYSATTNYRRLAHDAAAWVGGEEGEPISRQPTR
jgi:glycosyltransferase involved in cell wall biosynthesis